MMWKFIYFVWLASLPLAHYMADRRGRSSTVWLFATIVIGPFAPLALLILGRRENGAHEA